MSITFSDYLLQVSGASVVPVVGSWVRMVSNSTGTPYVSAAPTTPQGLFTIDVPGGIYTVYTGPSNTGPWAATGDANYSVSEGGGSSTLAADTDVQIGTPGAFDFLYYDLTVGKWRNGTPVAALSPITAVGDLIVGSPIAPGPDLAHAHGAAYASDAGYSTFPPPLAIDANDTTGFASNAVGASGQWLAVDLGALYTIGSSRLLFTSDGGSPDPPGSYVLEACDDNASWVAADTVAGPANDITRTFAAQTHRYWRCRSTGGTLGGRFTVKSFELRASIVGPNRLPAGAEGTLAQIVGGIPQWSNAVVLEVQALQAVNSGIFNVKDPTYGAKGDGKYVLDAGVTSGATAISSATAAFTAGDTGKVFGLAGAGHATSNADYGGLTGTLTYTDATHAASSLAASSTVAAALFAWGTNDTAAIQAALTAAAAAGGGTVYLPKGIYITTAALILAPNVAIAGAGRGATQIFKVGEPNGAIIGSSSTAYSTTPDNDVTIRDLTVGMVGPNQRSGAGHGIFVAAANFLVENVEVAVPGGGYSVTSLGIAILNAAVGTPCGPGTVRGCYVRNSIADGIFTGNSQQVLVEANFIFGSGDDGISCHGGNSGGHDQTDTVIRANFIYNSRARGIAVLGGVRTQVVNNIIYNCFLAGIAAVSGTPWTALDTVQIEGNTLWNVSLNTQPTYVIGPTGAVLPTDLIAGILVQGATAKPAIITSISGNQIRNCRGPFVAIQGSSNGIDAVTIVDNDFITAEGNGASAGQLFVTRRAGIYAENMNVDWLLIDGNTFDVTNYEAIYLAASVLSAVKIRGNFIGGPNQLAGATVAAIKLLGSGVALVADNLLVAAGGATNFADMTGAPAASQIYGNATAGLPIVNNAGHTTPVNA